MIYEYCIFSGKHAIFDSKSRVYYFPFKTEKEAKNRADNANKIARLELERDKFVWDSKRRKVTPYLIEQVENEITDLKDVKQ